MATRSIVPRTNSEGSLGTTLKRWLTAFIDTLTLTNPLDVASGGTGVSSLTEGGLLVGGGSGDITALAVATNGQVPIGDGTTAPTLATITAGTGIDITNGAGSITIDLDLKANGGLVIEGVNNELAVDLGASAITGTLAVGDGGTGVGTFTLNGILYGNAATSVLVTAAGTVAGQLLTCGATPFVPAWTTATYPASTTINQLLYSSSANVIAGLATGNSGVLVTSGAGIPSIATDIPTAVTIGSAYIYRAAGTDVPATDGGTGASTLTDHGVLVGSGTDPVTALAVGTNGQVLVGSTGADPVFATITDGEGIDTTLGAGTLTIAAETASETNPGVIEIATDAETIAGSDTARAITASNLKAKLGTQTDGGLLVGAGQTAAVEALAAGATTEILVGGGVGVNPVWTTATGTGAPVRADNATLSGPALGTPSSGDLQNATLATPTTKGVVYLEPKVNLLTNSQWMAMSGSTAENVGSQLVASWTNSDYDTFTSSGADITSAVYTTAGTQNADTASIVLTSGKLYKIVATETHTSGDHLVLTGTGGVPTTTLTAGANTIVFEATAAATILTVTNTAAANNSCTFTLYEITPGYVAADDVAQDRWKKDSNGGNYPNIYRQHNDATFTKAGSFYSLKFVSDNAAGTRSQVYWAGPEQTNIAYLAQFAGRTVTFGAWVYTNVASNAKLYISDNEANPRVETSATSFHTGGSTWEWLEVTRTLSSTSRLAFGFSIADTASQTAYFSQPMLVFGSSIGQGNYAPKVGEVVSIETAVNISISGVDGTLNNMEALSSGKIGKGVKAYYGRLTGTYTAADYGFAVSPINNKNNGLYILTQRNGVMVANGRVAADINGDLYSTGDDTFTSTTLIITAIEP